MVSSRWDVETCQLHVPPLNELADVLRGGLTSQFADVQVSVVDCPDLSLPPFLLAAPGTLLNVSRPSVSFHSVFKH